MKNTKKIISLGFLVLSLQAYADPVTSSSNASTASVETSAAAGNSSNAQNINFNSTPLETTTLRTVGNASLGGFSGSFSSDFCGATAQAGLGVVGFGISAGLPKIDNTCVMLRTFERTQQAASSLSQIDPIGSDKLRKASIAILAEIDPKIKLIYEKHGLLDSNGLGVVGKIPDLNAKTKISASEVKPDSELKVDAISNINSKMSASHSQVKAVNNQQVEVIPLVDTPLIPPSESSDNPKQKSLWDRLKEFANFKS